MLSLNEIQNRLIKKLKDNPSFLPSSTAYKAIKLQKVSLKSAIIIFECDEDDSDISDAVRDFMYLSLELPLQTEVEQKMTLAIIELKLNTGWSSEWDGVWLHRIGLESLSQYKDLESVKTTLTFNEFLHVYKVYNKYYPSGAESFKDVYCEMMSSCNITESTYFK